MATASYGGCPGDGGGVGGHYGVRRAFVTDNNCPPNRLATCSNRLSNRFWGRLRGPFPSNVPLL